MACLALFPCLLSRFSVQVQAHRCVSSCQCRQQRFGSLSSSRSSCFRRGSSSSCRDLKSQRGGIDVVGFVSSQSSRLWKSISIPAFNFVGGATSSPNEIGFDNECRPALKPAKNYTVHEAKLDEELWAAAWIRAESYCEEQPYVRCVSMYKLLLPWSSNQFGHWISHVKVMIQPAQQTMRSEAVDPEDDFGSKDYPYVESYKKKFAEQEFDALKRRLLGKYGQSIRHGKSLQQYRVSKCIILRSMTQIQDRCFPRLRIDYVSEVSGRSSQNSTMNGTQSATVLERVVGTLDLSVRQLSQGETFPGDSIRATLPVAALDFRGSHQYGYIANVCVTKAARQIGLGSSLLGTAINASKDWGLRDLYVHVNSSNKAAQCLYNKFKFQSLKVLATEHMMSPVI